MTVPRRRWLRTTAGLALALGVVAAVAVTPRPASAAPPGHGSGVLLCLENGSFVRCPPTGRTLPIGRTLPAGPTSPTRPTLPTGSHPSTAPAGHVPVGVPSRTGPPGRPGVTSHPAEQSPTKGAILHRRHGSGSTRWVVGAIVAALAAVAVVRRRTGADRPRPVLLGALRRRHDRLVPTARRRVLPVRMRTMASVVAAAALVYNSVVWVRVHTTSADGYRRFAAWESTHIPPGTTMSVTDGSAQFLLRDLVLGDWDTLGELRAHQVQWVLVSVRLIDQGYTASAGFLKLLETRGQLRYSSAQPIGLRLYDVRSLTGAP